MGMCVLFDLLMLILIHNAHSLNDECIGLTDNCKSTKSAKILQIKFFWSFCLKKSYRPIFLSIN